MKLLPLLLSSLLVGRSLSEPGQCEEISIPMCKEIGYNFTRLPNQFNHESQDEVRYSGIFGLLVRTQQSWLDGLINKENDKKDTTSSSEPELSNFTEINAFFCLKNIERNAEN